MRRSALTLTALLAACAATPAEVDQAAVARSETAAALERELAGLVPGEPSACLPQPGRVQASSRTYGPAIVYAVSRGRKYRNDTTGGCERAGNGRDALITQSTQARPCRGDIVRTVDPVSGIQTGACSLGDFVPYRRP